MVFCGERSSWIFHSTLFYVKEPETQVSWIYRVRQKDIHRDEKANNHLFSFFK